jgi:hypothetical protein
MYIYINIELLRERPNTNAITWNMKNMLFEDLMSNVDESAYENNLSNKDPIALDEPNENEVEHDPFEFPLDNKIPFSRLLFDPIVWQVQGSDNGDANPNMPLLNDDVRVFDAPP